MRTTMKAAVLLSRISGQYDPASEGHMFLRLEAEAITGLSNGDAVASWPGTNGVGPTATQATGSKQPAWIASAINGRPAVRFATDDALATPAVDLTHTQAVTVFAVVNPDDTAVNKSIVEMGGGLSAGGFSLFVSNVDTAIAIHNGNVGYSSDESSITVTQPAIIEGVFDRSRLSREATVWVNGGTGGARSFDNNNTDVFTNAVLNIGSRNGSSQFFNGDIAVIYGYDSALSEAARQRVRNYLNNKYGLYTAQTFPLFEDDAYSEVRNIPSGGGEQYRYTSPGARLVFQTTATEMTVATYNNLYGSYPAFTSIGVRVNGVDHATLEPGAAGTADIVQSLPGGEQTVEIINGLQILSNQAGTFVTNVTFNAPAVQVSPAIGSRLLIYGDSITVGDKADSPALEGYVQLVRNAYNGSVINEGLGSRSLHTDCSTELKRQAFVAHIAAQSPSLIWLAIGTNDYGLSRWSATNFGTAYADFLDKLHAALPDATIYAQTPLVRTSEAANGSGDTLGDYRTQIATAQSTRSEYVVLVDGTDILSTSDLADSVHPTTAGHAKYAAYVLSVLGID